MLSALFAKESTVSLNKDAVRQTVSKSSKFDRKSGNILVRIVSSNFTDAVGWRGGVNILWDRMSCEKRENHLPGSSSSSASLPISGSTFSDKSSLYWERTWWPTLTWTESSYPFILALVNVLTHAIANAQLYSYKRMFFLPNLSDNIAYFNAVPYIRLLACSS